MESFERLVQVLDALGNKIRLGLLIRLLGGKVSFTDLVDSFRLNPNALSHHLKLLENAGLVDNIWEAGSDYHSFYLLSNKGRKLLDSLGITPDLLPKNKQNNTR